MSLPVGLRMLIDRAIALPLMLLAALTMVLAAAPDAKADDSKILTIGAWFGPLSLDPARAGTGSVGVFIQPAYEPLVRTRADGSLEPALAIAWEVSADNREATITLREDARFSDGVPVNAEAVKKSIEYWVNTKGPFSVNLAALSSIELLGEYKFKLVLSRPHPDFVSLFNGYWLAGYIISPNVLGDPEILKTETFGAGPYKLDTANSISGKSYSYIPNEHYYDQSRIKWEKIVISVFEDQNAAMQAMRTGQLKLLYSDALTANANEASLPDNIRILSDPTLWVGLYLLDRGGELNPAFADIRVRQALNYGVDRELITKALFGKFGYPTNQLQTTIFPGYDAEAEGKFHFDPDLARKLLAEAGYANGLTIKTVYPMGTLHSLFTQALAGELLKIGVTLEAREVTGIGAMGQALRNREAESLVFALNSGEPSIISFMPLNPNGALNYYKSEDAELARLMAAAAEATPDKYDEAWKAVYRHVVDMAWFVPVSGIRSAAFISTSVTAPSMGRSIFLDPINVVPAE